MAAKPTRRVPRSNFRVAWQTPGTACGAPGRPLGETGARGRLAELQDQLAAVGRAEERLAAGAFGISIESGTAIPDGRLEANPTAERTVEEEARIRRA